MSKQERYGAILKKMAFPPFYFFAGIVLSPLCYLLFPTCNIVVFPFNLSGLLLMIVGLFLIIHYTVIFQRNKTTLLNEPPSSFITNGVFKYSRNPMYLGGLIFHVGLSLLTGNIIAFLIPVGFFAAINWICIPYEEDIMLETFQDEYHNYKKLVRRWL